MERAEIEKQLGAIGDIIAGVLVPGHQESELGVELLKSSDVATAMKVQIGEKAAFAKLFNGDDTAMAAFVRERRALELLNATQVPRLLFVAEPQRLIVTSYIEGTALNEVLTADNLMLTAEHMGQWFGAVSNTAPAEPQSGSWAEYLLNYQEGFNPEVLEQQRPILEQTQINRLTLAHNDNALSNFILGQDKRLYAVDFEDSRMKPEGWDLVTTASALFRRFPEEVPTISNALLRGYRLSAKDCSLIEAFDQLISVLVVANALGDA